MAGEKKKVKVSEINLIKRSYAGKNGPMFIHEIGVENDPQKWEYHSSKETCDSFKVGDIIEAEFEIKQNGQYTNYHFRPIAEKSSGGGKGFARAVDEGAIIMQSCISSACVLYQQSMEATPERVLEAAELFYKAVIKKSTTQTQYK